jgi:3(or 17)beta-hydroxysteroid dehydrogenase
MGRVAGKIVLITGAASGLGAADARTLAREGARVVLADVAQDGAEAVAREIGDRARAVALDVRDERAWVALMADIKAREGRLDVLVNNAGVVRPGTPEDVTAEDLRLILDVSVNGTIWGCKHAIPLMREGGGGSIINMASITAIQGHPRSVAYTAAKGAVDAYTRAVAVHCAQLGLGIRCNVLLPDRIDTPMVRGMMAATTGMNPALADHASSKPDNSLGTVEDVANLVLFLASDESRFISGQSFVIDNTASITKGYVPPLASR